jgi:hypothetical protein
MGVENGRSLEASWLLTRINLEMAKDAELNRTTSAWHFSVHTVTTLWMNLVLVEKRNKASGKKPTEIR